MRHLLDAVDRLGRLDADDLEQGRREVAGVAELVAQLALGGDALAPGHDQRIADAAAVGVLLVAAQRRVGGHRPAQREVGMGVGPADVVDARDLLLDRLALQVVGAHGVDHAERPALLAGAVVGHDHDQRVVELARRLEEGHQPREVLVGMVEHGGVGGLQAREQAALALGHVGPGAHRVVARRQARALRHDAELDLAGEPLLALDVPAVGEQRIVFLDQVERRLVRRVAGAQRQPGQPRRLLVVGDVVGEIADGLVDQVGGQVIARWRSLPGRIDRRVVAHQLGRVLVGLGIHEAVVAVEAAAERPAVERAGGAGLGERRDVPLAQHVVAIAVRAQHLGDGAGLARDLAAIARVARIEVGEAADAHRMMVAAGQQGGARGRAHRRGVEAGVAQAAAGDGVDGRRGDGRAVAAEVGEADIVEQDDQDVGGALLVHAKRTAGSLGPVGRGLPDRLADCRRHAFPRCFASCPTPRPRNQLVRPHGSG